MLQILPAADHILDVLVLFDVQEVALNQKTCCNAFRES